MIEAPDHADHLCAYFIRRTILQQSKRAHVGHIGSALSVADIIAALYGEILEIDDPDDPGRDRLVLSKGHAALALFAALRARGWIDEATLATFNADASLLGVHPEHALRGIDFSTGSLGHGLSIATGSALAARLSGAPRRTFAVLSDAECDEGSTWEAVMFAAHHRLSGLIAIVDVNGQQALGYTNEVLSLAPLVDRWRAFGWEAVEVDGHDRASLVRTIRAFDTTSGPPHVVLARTVFGRGVSYMEGTIKWHYWPMSDDEYRQALAENEELGCAQRSSGR